MIDSTGHDACRVSYKYNNEMEKDEKVKGETAARFVLKT